MVMVSRGLSNLEKMQQLAHCTNRFFSSCVNWKSQFQYEYEQLATIQERTQVMCQNLAIKHE
jgi:hypothetical protein